MRPLLMLCASASVLACGGAAGTRDTPPPDSIASAARAAPVTTAPSPGAVTPAATPAATPAPAVSDTTLPGLQAFWARFREALLADDSAAVTALVRFPLTVRGSLDSDPAQRIGAAELAPVLHQLLEANVGTLAAPRTTRAWLQRTPSLEAGALAPGGQEARVGPFAFAYTADGWRLVLLYLEE